MLYTPYKTLEDELLGDLVLGLRGAATASTSRVWKPLPHQIPPPGRWRVWVVIGGRGAGKTRTGVEHVIEHLRRYGPRARVGIGAPTLTAARDVCAEGDSGLITLYRSEFVSYTRSLNGLEARHRDGGFVKFLGAEKPRGWNGPQWTLLWCDELALWNEESWDQAQFGLRLRLPDGAPPQAICTTTPKARLFVKKLLAESFTVSTRAKTSDNPHLDQDAQDFYQKKYGGTKLGRQELDGEFLSEVEGALWSWGMIDTTRIAYEQLPPLQRLVVAVDPAGSAKVGGKGAKPSDYSAIAAAGLGIDGEFYVLHSERVRLSPNGWAKRAIAVYDEWEADRILGEVNKGGDMVESTLRNVRESIPYSSIHATRGKVLRAEPVVALYEQHRVHHVGTSFATLEDAMTTFPVACEYDDEVDALVYALTDLSTHEEILIGRA